MAGFRANTNRCGASPSLAGGKAHPRGSLVSGATGASGYQVESPTRRSQLFEMRPRRLAPRAPHFQFPRRGAAEYDTLETRSRLISLTFNSGDNKLDKRCRTNELSACGCIASDMRCATRSPRLSYIRENM